MMIVSIFITKAQVIVYESFNYTVNDTMPAPWVTVNSGDSIVVNSGNLSYTGLAASEGNKIAFEGYGKDYQQTVSSITAGTVYMSFIINVTDLGSLNATGGYFAGFVSGTTNFGCTVWTKLNGTGFNIGVNARSTVTYTSWSTEVFQTNTPILVVVSYQIVAGTTNDIANMWINPLATNLGASTAPTATVTITNGGTDLATIDKILLRQDSPSETPNTELDELRLGTTWASVTPTANAINAVSNEQNIKIYPNPATSQVTISTVEKISNVKIFDIQGKMVKELSNINANQINVDVTELSSSVYSVVVVSNNGNTFNSRIVK